jgi:hypothetical protein
VCAVVIWREAPEPALEARTQSVPAYSGGRWRRVAVRWRYGGGTVAYEARSVRRIALHMAVVSYQYRMRSAVHCSFPSRSRAYCRAKTGLSFRGLRASLASFGFCGVVVIFHLVSAALRKKVC